MNGNRFTLIAICNVLTTAHPNRCNSVRNEMKWMWCCEAWILHPYTIIHYDSACCWWHIPASRMFPLRMSLNWLLMECGALTLSICCHWCRNYLIKFSLECEIQSILPSSAPPAQHIVCDTLRPVHPTTSSPSEHLVYPFNANTHLIKAIKSPPPPLHLPSLPTPLSLSLCLHLSIIAHKQIPLHNEKKCPIRSKNQISVFELHYIASLCHTSSGVRSRELICHYRM